MKFLPEVVAIAFVSIPNCFICRSRTFCLIYFFGFINVYYINTSTEILFLVKLVTETKHNFLSHTKTTNSIWHMNCIFALQFPSFHLFVLPCMRPHSWRPAALLGCPSSQVMKSTLLLSDHFHLVTVMRKCRNIFSFVFLSLKLC